MRTRKLFISSILLFSMLLGACAQLPGGPGAPQATPLPIQDTPVPSQPAPQPTGATPQPGSQTGADNGFEWLVQQLKANGATILSTEEVEVPFFPVKAKVMTVNGASIQIFEFASEADRQTAQRLISADGSTVGSAKVQLDLSLPVRFWAQGRLIVQYTGKEQALIELLSKILGAPITTPVIQPVDPNTPAVQAAIQELGRILGIGPEDIAIVSTEEVQWPDGCLGLGGPAEACLLVIIPGYRVVLSVQGSLYVFRTDLEGKQVRMEPSPATSGPTPQPSSGGLYTIPVNAAVEELKAFLKDNLDKIVVVSSEQVNFSDSCLELGQANESCATVITPGWKIVLSVNGKEYEFHTTMNADVVRMKPIEPTTSSAAGEQVPAAVKAAKQDLSARLGIAVDQIEVVSYEHVDWPDACLGIHKPAMGCATVITPGWLVVLSAGGQSYEYHTNEDGSVVRLKE